MFELCDKAGGYHLKHYGLRQTHPLYWEQSRHGACSRLADSTLSVGSATDLIDQKKKKPNTSILQLQGGHSSSFHFQMFTTWKQPMWMCTVTQITGRHMQNCHPGFTDPVRKARMFPESPSTLLVPPLRQIMMALG